MTDPATVEKVARAHKAALAECCERRIECPGCNGRGWLSSRVWRSGHDPDWHATCGGTGQVTASSEEQMEQIAAIAAIAAYEQAIKDAGMVVVPRDAEKEATNG